MLKVQLSILIKLLSVLTTDAHDHIMSLMNLRIEFNHEKDLILREARGVGFEEIIQAIKKGGTLDELKHHDPKKYPNQRILVVKIKNYVYAVPFVIDKKKEVIFLKTAYPSRVLTRKYLKKKSK